MSEADRHKKCSVSFSLSANLDDQVESFLARWAWSFQGLAETLIGSTLEVILAEQALYLVLEPPVPQDSTKTRLARLEDSTYAQLSSYAQEWGLTLPEEAFCLFFVGFEAFKKTADKAPPRKEELKRRIRIDLDRRWQR